MLRMYLLLLHATHTHLLTKRNFVQFKPFLKTFHATSEIWWAKISPCKYESIFGFLVEHSFKKSLNHMVQLGMLAEVRAVILTQRILQLRTFASRNVNLFSHIPCKQDTSIGLNFLLSSILMNILCRVFACVYTIAQATTQEKTATGTCFFFNIFLWSFDNNTGTVYGFLFSSSSLIAANGRIWGSVSAIHQ